MEEDEQAQTKKQKENENERLWQELNIDFRLEAFKFPDNKIYGIININPESSRKLIKTFVLVVNKTTRIEFDPHYIHLSASGFNINRSNPSAYIEAKPVNTKWAQEIKTSKICYFFFTGEVFALSPTISFVWSNDEKNSKADLAIKWYHIGDKHAQKYILYLDDIGVHYIRQKLIDDAFDIRISAFKPGEKHTFQLVAKLNNGKETYRSDLMEFTVPDKTNADSTEFITVSNEPAPPNLPAYIATKEDKTEEDFYPTQKKEKEDLHQNQKPEKDLQQNQKPEKDLRQNQTKEKEDFHQKQKREKDDLHQNQKKEADDLSQNQNQFKPKAKKRVHTCCNHLPHKTFPGIEHYFNKVPSSEENTDDDEDVIIFNN